MFCSFSFSSDDDLIIYFIDVSKLCVALVTPLTTSNEAQLVIKNETIIKKMNIALIVKSIYRNCK